MNKEYLQQRLTEINNNLVESKNKLDQLMVNHNVLIGCKEEIVRWINAPVQPKNSEF